MLNWLRHYNILIEGATLEQQQQISRSLSTQISSLKLRGLLATDPVDALLVAIALVGVSLCADRSDVEIAARVKRVQRLLDEQIDEDGLHRTRSRQGADPAPGRTHHHPCRRCAATTSNYSNDLSELTESMQRALDAISLGTGEPAYFNGTGQMPHDLIVAVQAQSAARARSTGTAGGYGRLICRADRSLLPIPVWCRSPNIREHAHASALAFEFSHGRDLIVCNCGPAPPDYEDALLFRQGIAHSAPTINALSAAAIPSSGPLAGRLVQIGRAGRDRGA